MSTSPAERVRHIVARYLKLPDDQVDYDRPLQELGLDSMGALEIIFQLEDEFDVLVPNDRAREFTTVRSIGAGIDALRQRKLVAPAE